MTPEVLAEWRENAERMQTVNWAGEPVADLRILSLIDALEDMTREARLSREATEKAVQSMAAAKSQWLSASLAGIKTHNGEPLSPKNLRWAATHEALCRSFIFDVLTGLADRLEGREDAE